MRDLLDSMYRGFPVGYLMLWNAAEVDSQAHWRGPQTAHADGVHRRRAAAADGLYAVMKGAEITFKDFSKGGSASRSDLATGSSTSPTQPSRRTPSSFPTSPIYGPARTGRSSRPSSSACAPRNQRLSRRAGEATANCAPTPERPEGLPIPGRADRYEVDEERVAKIFMRVNSGGTCSPRRTSSSRCSPYSERRTGAGSKTSLARPDRPRRWEPEPLQPPRQTRRRPAAARRRARRVPAGPT